MAQISQLLHDGYQHHLRGQFDDAARIYRKILRAEPGNADVWVLLGIVCDKQMRHEEAIERYDKAIRFKPESPQAHYNRGVALTKLRRYAEAVPSFERAYDLRPTLLEGLSELAHARRVICDWRDFSQVAQELPRAAREGRIALSPFMMLLFSDAPADQFAAARNFLVLKEIRQTAPRRAGPPAPATRGRIRLAYFSADLREHAVAHHLAPLIERHDRNRFEVTAISLAPRDASRMRARLTATFDRFVEAAHMSGEEMAQAIAELGIDILVDLTGLTGGHRIEVLARTPAPIQVEFLGYAGTTGADFIDYIIADSYTVPNQLQPDFSEWIVHLPGCYLPDSADRPAVEKVPTRAECGLPDDSFVFCSFNQPIKFTPDLFSVWMRLLARVPGSVLWLRSDDETAGQNLRAEASARGIDPARLVFASRVSSHAEHLSRQRLAGLFLDTFPYNAHSTACDALWAGLPIVTRAGRSFQSRVAGSMLHTTGLPELITSSFEEYEALAFALATEPARLADLKKRLAQKIKTTPLFDIERYTRHLEAAYEEMVAIRRRGEQPHPFKVEPIAG